MIKLQLFEKEMNRREFLGHIGALFLAVIGVSGLIKFFVSREQIGGSPMSGNGYGGDPYGGSSAHR